MTLWTSAENGLTNAVLFSYTLSYLGLNALLAFFIWSNNGPAKTGWTDAFLLGSALRNYVHKLCLVALLFALAGLPPFHSFPLKLAALALFLKLGTWAPLAGLIGVLFCSWYAYQAFAFRLLTSSTLRTFFKTRPSATAAFAAFALLLGLFCGFCFLDDLIFLVLWLS